MRNGLLPMGLKAMLLRATMSTALLVGASSVVGGEGIGKRESRLRSLLRAPVPPMMDQVTSEGFRKIEINYGGQHPFERELKPSTTLEECQPIRIHFITGPLETRRGISPEEDAKIDTIVHRVLPFLQKSWSKHLSVFPAKGPIEIHPMECFGFYDTEIPPEFLDQGIPNADVAILVSAQDVLTTGAGQDIKMCGGPPLARAKACSLDQYDRPVLGYINFCISGNALQTDAQVLDMSLVGLHEFGHVLGMDSDLFLYFRDPITGAPLTPRPFKPEKVRCVDGTLRTSIFPSNKTLMMGQTNSGLVYYDVVTPRVRTVARNHFNCPSLQGSRLENQPLLNTCSGNHWDERLFYSEVLSSLFSMGGEGDGAVLSPLTLALMEDSGWYKVSYVGSELSSYGHGLGCDFVYKDCIVNDTVPAYGKDVFCDTPVHLQNGEVMTNDMPIYCDPCHTSFGLCNLFDATEQPNPFGVDPSRKDVRYFSDKRLTTVHEQSDFCPTATIDIGIDCTDDSTNPSKKFYTGEVYGPGSRCINAFTEADGVSAKVVRPACLSLVCDELTRKVIVGGHVCDFDGQVHAFPSTPGRFFECPRLTTVCPHLFCPAGCSGRGECDFNANPPRCNCFDTTDTSAECSAAGSFTSSQSSSPSPASAPPTPLPTALVTPSPTPLPTPSTSLTPTTASPNSQTNAPSPTPTSASNPPTSATPTTSPNSPSHAPNPTPTSASNPPSYFSLNAPSISTFDPSHPSQSPMLLSPSQGPSNLPTPLSITITPSPAPKVPGATLSPSTNPSLTPTLGPSSLPTPSPTVRQDPPTVPPSDKSPYTESPSESPTTSTGFAELERGDLSSSACAFEYFSLGISSLLLSVFVVLIL